jgi:hypothetical protein
MSDAGAVTIPAAHEPPFALDGSVTRDKLIELLAVGTELPWLDYKAEADLSGAAGVVELTKDVGAMSILGGYLVVGADDSGEPLGLPATQPGLFDEATLSAKFAKYLAPGFEVRSAVHDVGDSSGPRPVAVIWVAPHPDGWCIFTRNGDYTDYAGKARSAFRAGDVYARHGSRSEPWAQADITAARRLLVTRAKEAWRAEHAQETRLALQGALAGAGVAAGPSAVFTHQLDAASFEAAAVELLRRGDDVPIRRMLRSASADVERLVGGGEPAAQDLVTALDRMATLAALGLELRRPAFFAMPVRALLDVYGWGVEKQYVAKADQMRLPILWLRIAERLFALGGLAVRLSDWDAVRELALGPVPALQGDPGGSPSWTWHRHSLTQASRGSLFQEQTPDGRSRELSLLLFARAVAVADPALRPDLPGDIAVHGGADPLLTSLCQFDLLLTVVTGAAAGATTERQLLDVSYPNFAQANSQRANGVVRTLLFDAQARQALVPGVNDQRLALVLSLADQAALRAGQSYWGWDGYSDDDVRAFIAANSP